LHSYDLVWDDKGTKLSGYSKIVLLELEFHEIVPFVVFSWFPLWFHLLQAFGDRRLKILPQRTPSFHKEHKEICYSAINYFISFNRLNILIKKYNFCFLSA